MADGAYNAFRILERSKASLDTKYNVFYYYNDLDPAALKKYLEENSELEKDIKAELLSAKLGKLTEGLGNFHRAFFKEELVRREKVPPAPFAGRGVDEAWWDAVYQQDKEEDRLLAGVAEVHTDSAGKFSVRLPRGVYVFIARVEMLQAQFINGMPLPGRYSELRPVVWESPPIRITAPTRVILTDPLCDPCDPF